MAAKVRLARSLLREAEGLNCLVVFQKINKEKEGGGLPPLTSTSKDLIKYHKTQVNSI